MAKIDNISEISKLLTDCNSVLYKFFKSFKALKVPQIVGGMKVAKRSGMSILDIIVEMIVFFLQQQSIFSGARLSCFKPSGVESQKNTFYNFMTSSRVNFRTLLQRVAMSCILKMTAASGESERKKFIVFDDTMIEKTGFRIEGVSKCYDHAGNRYVIGYKNLTATITDGIYNFVFDFSLVGESKKDPCRGLKEEDFQQQFKKNRTGNPVSQERVDELTESKMNLCLKMLRTALKMKLTPDYALFDSWFSTQEFIAKILEISDGKTNVICMLKKGNTTCEVDSKLISIKKLVETKQCQKFAYSKKYKCNYLKIKCKYGTTTVSIFLVRPQKSASIFVILSTDTSLNFNKVFEHYHLRWSIEVTFRDCKQYLGLKSCHSRDFDAQICHTTLSFLTYNVLNYHRCLHENGSSLDGLFVGMRIEATALSLSDKIMSLLEKILDALCDFIQIDFGRFLHSFLSDNKAANNAVKGLLNLFAADNQIVSKMHTKNTSF